MEDAEELPIKSKSFENFLRKNGKNPKKWRKVVEKWASPDGTIYQRHYWTNGTEYYYHSEGIEEYFHIKTKCIEIINEETMEDNVHKLKKYIESYFLEELSKDELGRWAERAYYDLLRGGYVEVDKLITHPFLRKISQFHIKPNDIKDIYPCSEETRNTPTYKLVYYEYYFKNIC